MRRFALFLVFVLASLVVSHIMLRDSGYVLIEWNKMSYESSVWAFILLIVLVLLIGFALRYLVMLLLNIMGFIYPMTRTSRLQRAKRLSVIGLKYLVNGRWQRAQSCLSMAADAGESPVLNYLVAARAAQETGNFVKAKDYLSKADKSSPNAGFAVGIAQTQLLLAQNKSEQALATLKALHQKAPKHTYVLKLLQKVYLQLPDWQALASLLPKLKRHKVLKDAVFEQLQKRVYGEMFEQAYQQGRHVNDPQKSWHVAKTLWNGLTTQQKHNHDILAAYVMCLQKLGAENEAEVVLRAALHKHYDVGLVRLYGLLKSQDASRQLLMLENVLRKRPNDAELLLALGRLSQRNQLWGKAREYFLASIEQCPCVEAYHEVGRLLAHLGEYERSTEFFCLGLQLSQSYEVAMPPITHPEAHASL